MLSGNNSTIVNDINKFQINFVVSEIFAKFAPKKV